MAVEVKETIPNVNEKAQLSIKSDKFNHEFLVQPVGGGFVFYGISVTKGKVPDELQGKYTRMEYALAAIKRYEHKQPKSPSVQRDIKTERRDAAKLQRERTEHIHSGADNREG